MKKIYLDQNKWIQLARAYHGKELDPELQKLLRYLREATVNGSIVLPLSGIHYMETARIRDPGRRARLGHVMWELSQGATFASYHDILIHEIEVALSKRLPYVKPRPFTLIAHGIAHAFGVPDLGYQIPEPFRSTLPVEARDSLERAARDVIERALLTGEGPNGESAPPFASVTNKLAFKSHLANLHPRISQLPRNQWDDALMVISISDIVEPLNEVLAYHRVPANELQTDLKEELTKLANTPTRRIDLHLHREVLRNPKLQPKDNDLEDWAALAPAAAYCDIVVCENHIASMLSRNGFTTPAKVTTRVTEIPRLCESIV